MAAVRRLQLGDKRRPPARHEARLGVESGETGEAGVDEPEVAAGAVGHLVDQDVAGDVAGARQVAGVVRAGGLQAAGDVGDVAELPDLDGGADGEPGAAVGQGQAHRGLERAVVGVEAAPLVADHHELAGLIGGDQQRRAELPQQGGEVRRMCGAQRSRVLRSGEGRIRPWAGRGIWRAHERMIAPVLLGRVRRQAGVGTLGSHVCLHLRPKRPDQGGPTFLAPDRPKIRVENARTPRLIGQTS